MTVVDDSTYTITYERIATFEAGKGSPLDDYTVYYPRHLLEHLSPATFSEWEFWNRPIGNGPYRYVRHVPQTMLEFVANSDFYAGRSQVERVILKYIDEEWTELTSGNVDAVTYASRKLVLTQASDDRFEAYHDIGPDHNRVIAWNLRHELFREATVRQALTMAIDRIELRQVVGLPPEAPIFDVPPSARQVLARANSKASPLRS